jgi:hypothetical protein
MSGKMHTLLERQKWLYNWQRSDEKFMLHGTPLEANAAGSAMIWASIIISPRRCPVIVLVLQCLMSASVLDEYTALRGFVGIYMLIERNSQVYFSLPSRNQPLAG